MRFDDGTISIMYIISMLLLLLALAFIGNSVIDKDVGSGMKETGSSAMAGLFIQDPGSQHGTLYERYCFENSEYFGLRG